MTKLRKLFGQTEMRWKRVLIFALLTALYTAAVNIPAPLHDTSFSDIAVNLECWFLFALFIIVNCRTWKEASLKCFVFFLVSQPLIYLFEVPFTSLGWGLFGYYRRWFIVTVLTLPGAAVAFLVKKQNALSVAVLSVALTYLAWAAAAYCRQAAMDFPRHLLSSLFCAALGFFFCLVLLEKKKCRMAALLIFLALLLGFFVFTVLLPTGSGMELFLDSDCEWSCTVENEAVLSATVTDGGHIHLEGLRNGATLLRITSELGEENYLVRVFGRDIRLQPLPEGDPAAP